MQVCSVHWYSMQTYLSGKAPAKVHGTRTSFISLQPQHHCGGQLVMSSTTAGFLLEEGGQEKGKTQKVTNPPETEKWLAIEPHEEKGRCM